MRNRSLVSSRGLNDVDSQTMGDNPPFYSRIRSPNASSYVAVRSAVSCSLLTLTLQPHANHAWLVGLKCSKAGVPSSQLLTVNLFLMPAPTSSGLVSQKKYSVILDSWHTLQRLPLIYIRRKHAASAE